ncbi:MAG: glycosyltransferase family 4 protein [Armatimonadetes bacterium]|nr:glycosyltransferase family 4 protein [Armatimonadota bacterium]
MADKPIKVALLAPILTPYRIPVYQELGKWCDLRIFIGKPEPNRPTWHNLVPANARFSVKSSSGFLYRLKRSKGGKEFETRYIQIQPGYLLDLIRVRPHAIISVELGFRTLIALTFGTLTGAPVWIWFGGTIRSEGDIGRIKTGIRRFIARWAKHWISMGLSSTDYLVTLGVKPESVAQIQNCVDFDLFPKGTAPAVPGLKRPVLLFNGQMIARKGGLEFLQAVHRAQARGLEFSTLMVGGGSDEAQLRAFAEENNLQDVHWYPFQKPNAMAGFYASADVFVFPTLEDVWGLTPNEAILIGTPVLCSVHAGCCPEIIPAPEARFDPENPEDFDHALDRAVRGEIPPIDPSILKTPLQNAEIIWSDFQKHVRALRNK